MEKKTVLQAVTHKYENKVVEVLESREVAQAVGKEHSKLIRDIRTYIEYLNEAKIGLVDFFIESTYIDGKGETRPCYLITKKGCEMIANKMTGKKGVIFTAQYVNAFHDMQETIHNQITELEEMKIKAQAERAKAMLINAENRRLKLLLSNPNWQGISDVALQTMGIKAVESVTGQNLGNLLPECEKTYSATEVCRIFDNITNPCTLGKKAKALGLQDGEKYGIWVMDKSPYSPKEVKSFRYNSNGVKALADAFNVENYSLA